MANLRLQDFLLILVPAVLVVYVTRAYAQPEILWNRTYGGTSDDSSSCLAQARGCYLVVGTTKSFGVSGSAIYLLKVDENGNPVWNVTFDLYGTDSATDVAEAADGGHVVLGRHLLVDDFFDWIIRIDDYGNKLWERQYGGMAGSDLWDICRVPAGRFLVAGGLKTENRSLDAYVMMLDNEGEKLWDRAYGTDSFDRFHGIEPTADGGFLLLGFTGGLASEKDCYLVRIDGEGQTIWEKTYPRNGTAEGASVATETVSHSFIVGGLEMDTESGRQRIYLFEIDPQGEKVWERTLGEAYWQYLAGILPTHEGYIVAGATPSPQTGLASLYLAKIDDAGEVLWNATIAGEGCSLGADGIIESWEGGFVIAGSSSPAGGKSDILILAGCEPSYHVTERLLCPSIAMLCFASVFLGADLRRNNRRLASTYLGRLWQQTLARQGSPSQTRNGR